jgi:hypothetical protein
MNLSADRAMRSISYVVPSQGSEERATLGETKKEFINPAWVESIPPIPFANFFSSPLCSAIHKNYAFSEKFSKITNNKFSMTNFQFRLSALVAAAAALRPRDSALIPSRLSPA